MRGYFSSDSFLQIVVNKHCGFANEGAVASDHHVVGAHATAAPTAVATASVTATQAVSGLFGAPTSAVPTANLFATPATSAPAKQPHHSGFATAPSFGAPSTLNVQASNFITLTQATSLPVALKNTTLSPQQGTRCYPSNVSKLNLVSALLGPMTGKPDAKAVLEGAFELFLYNRDVPEFLHTVSRVARVV